MALKDDITNLFTNYKYTVTEIAKELGCSRDVVKYHTDPDYKQRTLDRIVKQREEAKMDRSVVILQAKAREKQNKPEKPPTAPQPKPMVRPIIDRRPKKEERRLPNRDLQLEGKRMVKIDHKTWVYR